MDDVLKIALLAFVQVFMVALQTRNAAQSRYLAGFLTSMCIGFTWTMVLSSLAKNQFTIYGMLAYTIGNASGWVCGIYAHKHFTKEKSPKDW